jgi:hypothetical protein
MVAEVPNHMLAYHTQGPQKEVAQRTTDQEQAKR